MFNVELISLVLQGQMKLERPQILTLLRKVMKKLYKYLSDIASKEFELAPSRIKEVSQLSVETLLMVP